MEGISGDRVLLKTVTLIERKQNEETMDHIETKPHSEHY